MNQRLDKLRETLTVSWAELQTRLGCSESMLYFMRKGDRNPSPKLLRRIMELETEAGLSPPSPPRLQVRDGPSDYVPKVDRKHLHIVELRKQISIMEAQLASLKKTLEDADG